MAVSEFANGGAFWVILLALLLCVTGYALWRWLPLQMDLLIQRRSRLFGAAERNFFECLYKALQDDYYIFAKVRVLDVAQPSPATNLLHKRAFELRYRDEHLDFVLCKKNDMSIFGVVELENFEQRGRAVNSKTREKAIAELCTEANFRLFYFDVRQDYKDMDIRRLITGRARSDSSELSGTHQSQLTLDGASVSDFSKIRSCPKCNSEVVTKVAIKGERIGEKFLMCRKYPYCDYKVSVNDAKVLKEKRKRERNAAKPGFSDWSGG